MKRKNVHIHQRTNQTVVSSRDKSRCQSKHGQPRSEKVPVLATRTSGLAGPIGLCLNAPPHPPHPHHMMRCPPPLRHGLELMFKMPMGPISCLRTAASIIFGASSVSQFALSVTIPVEGKGVSWKSRSAKKLCSGASTIQFQVSWPRPRIEASLGLTSARVTVTACLVLP